MILLLNENDFETYDINSKKSKITNYYGMENILCNSLSTSNVEYPKDLKSLY